MTGSISKPTLDSYGTHGLTLYQNRSLTSLSDGVVTLLLLISPNFDAASLPFQYLNNSELLDCHIIFSFTMLIPSSVILMDFMHSSQTIVKFSSVKSKSSG